MTATHTVPSPGGDSSTGHVPGVDHLLYERYLGDHRASPLMKPYYAIKPMLPRGAQLALRRRYARRQAQRTFPRWPIEPVLIERRDDEIRARLDCTVGDRLPLVGFWPDHHSCACILTHDVEGPAGIENIDRVIELEQRHGLTSSWNFVAEWYDIPAGTFDRLRAGGCEIGLHGIKHDGKLFSSRAQFDANLPRIHRYLRDWDVVGFRSPATHRNAEWMHELGCLYDSSFPDTDPFEPLSGGCCSIFPFMLGDIVELPITLMQDHTLMEILGERTIRLWREKCEWIAAKHGLVNVITHPDYLIDPDHLALYDQLLSFVAALETCWHGLPRTVAEWWRQRARLSCQDIGGEIQITGDSSAVNQATVMWARQSCGEIMFDL
jgi:peptidoglycan/xylan/chitin deacetylase (PgdA/CDA1 family)